MFSLRKAQRQESSRGAPLVLDGPGGSTLVLPADVVVGFRRMITVLKYRSDLPKRLGVLAALRGEGVTYTTLGLATTIASDLGAKVCAVELNWWSPGMERLLATTEGGQAKRRMPWAKQRSMTQLSDVPANSMGIAAVLSGQVKLEQALLSTSLPNLQVLPAGTLSAEKRPYTARSEALTACLDELNLRYDYVVIDVPAILVTSDAVAIASLADACCTVVQQGVTNTNTVRQALDEVKHAPMLGVVLNRTQISTPRWVRNLLPQE